MTWLDRMFGRETRARQSIRSDDPYLASFFGQRSGTGSYSDPDRASGLATAGACISIVSQALASVPLKLYRDTGNGGRDQAREHPLYGVLHDVSNQTQTAFEAREMLIASLMVTGNAYARLNWNGRGQVDGLDPLDPGNVSVERLESGRLRYKVSGAHGGGAQVYLQEEILHLRHRLARDGVMGLSPMHLARETFNLALTQQDTAGRQASRSLRPEGALVFPQALNHEQKNRVLDRLGEKIESNSNTGGVMVLDGGVEWQSFAFSSKDAEFLESRKLTNLDICRVFSVPPTVAGILDHGTYSNVEAEQRALVVRCLAPMAKRVEQAMNAVMLGVESRKTLFIEHDLAGLLRGDLKARYDAYRVGRDGGWLSANEIRGWENLSEIDDGNDYLSPLNMATAQDRQDPPAEDAV